jgi:hypothetical protein
MPAAEKREFMYANFASVNVTQLISSYSDAAGCRGFLGSGGAAEAAEAPGIVCTGGHMEMKGQGPLHRGAGHGTAISTEAHAGECARWLTR